MSPGIGQVANKIEPAYLRLHLRAFWRAIDKKVDFQMGRFRHQVLEGRLFSGSKFRMCGLGFSEMPRHHSVEDEGFANPKF